MPFKLEAQIAEPVIWTRAVYALSTISDTIKFTLRESDGDYEINLTAINTSKTSSLTCTFKHDFFQSLTVEGEVPVLESIQTFSFLINSKTMNVCFKDCENARELKLLVIHEGFEDSTHIFSNKLFVESLSTNGVTKNYSLMFRPGFSSHDLKISHVYRKLLRSQDRGSHDYTEHDKVHLLVMEIRVLKKFLGMFGHGLEDFKVELYPEARKILLHGYNRQELLSRQNTSWASQPMSLSMQLSLNDITEDNCAEGDDKSSASFRLRDFRTFVQLSGADAGDCSIIYSYAGSPVVFEKVHTRSEKARTPVCVVTLTMIGDGESIDATQLRERDDNVKSVDTLFVSESGGQEHEPAQYEDSATQNPEETGLNQIFWENQKYHRATKHSAATPASQAGPPAPAQMPDIDPAHLEPTQVPVAKGLFD
ncbi:hypothetical protein OGAPHI_004389 [Ogataea philodendri]|uniref:DNA repair protein rad9 n=1 Tax=Ogataea philodendri TaxID=1378263 RepID=A0A9P8T5K9_9ASCO|nr:uncharacterized protein OGAPHI_004389 [Ogataea philodendri]KAH3666200.1 hypothetical protein OGAPHI_004389 [Ogataea philodendri]